MSLLRPEPAASPVPFDARRGAAPAALAALRPRQWTKNLLLFAGLVFAEQFDHPARVGESDRDLLRLLRRLE